MEILSIAVIFALITISDSVVCNFRSYYYGPGHTCLRYLHEDEWRWQRAKEKCKDLSGGKYLVEPGRMAKIDNKEMNDFIIGLMPKTNAEAWIGLKYHSATKELRWDDVFPVEEKAKYTNLDNQKVNFCKNFYTVIRRSNWAMRPDTSFRNVICQHNPGVQKSSISCKKELLKENSPGKEFAVCQFHLPVWNHMTWYTPDGKAAVKCYSSSNKCTTLIPGVQGEIKSQGKYTIKATGPFIRRYNGAWGCYMVSKDSYIKQLQTCHVAVYEPIGKITCGSQLHSSFLTISCHAERAYPMVKCLWLYKLPGKRGFEEVPYAVERITLSKAYNVSDTEYFKTNCTIQLTTQNIQLVNGNLELQVQMFQRIGVKKQHTGKEARTNVTIVLPEDPVFLLFGKAINSYHLDLVEMQPFVLECLIDSGNPKVMSTHLKCDFHMQEEGDKMFNDSRPGTSYSMDRLGLGYMNGKMCSCWGSHLTGQLKANNLTFYVIYPAIVTSFSSVGVSATGVGVNALIHLTCVAHGNPTARASVMKFTSAEVNETIVLAHADVLVHKTLYAACSDNGLYLCIGSNEIEGEERTDSKEIAIRVKCPPTSCMGNRTVGFFHPVGSSSVMTFCVAAYPAPDVKQFHLLKADATNHWDVADKESSSIKTITYEDMLINVQVTFPTISMSDFGDYNLVYDGNTPMHDTPMNDTPINDTPMNDTLMNDTPVVQVLQFSLQERKLFYTTLYFLLTVALAIPLVLIALIAVIVISTMYFRRPTITKRTPKAEPDTTDEEHEEEIHYEN